MKTLVTGANGHIGSHIVKRLLKEGRDVRALVRKTSDLRGIEGLDCEIVYGDVLDLGSLKRAVKGCRVIYHTAAVYAVWAIDPKDILEPAITGSKNLFAAISRRSIDKIVYTSSIAAALGPCPSPDTLISPDQWNENPGNPYLRAKTESERCVHEWIEKHHEPVVFVLPAIVLGPNDYKPTPSNKLVLQYINSIQGVYFDGGLNVVDVRDVAYGQILAEKKGKVGRRYILGGHNMTFKEFFTMISEITNRRMKPWFKIPKWMAISSALFLEKASKITNIPSPFTSQEVEEIFGGYAYFDLTRTKKELGLSPRPVKETLIDTVNWFFEIKMVNPLARLISRRS